MLKKIKNLLSKNLRVKLYRYGAVSFLNIVVTQFLLWLFNLWLSGIYANIVAVVLAAGPAFFLYKFWVWPKSGDYSIQKEVPIFWSMALAGLGFSTFTVWLTTSWWDGFWALALGNIAGFAIVWVGRFILLETYLFKTQHK